MNTLEIAGNAVLYRRQQIVTFFNGGAVAKLSLPKELESQKNLKPVALAINTALMCRGFSPRVYVNSLGVINTDVSGKLMFLQQSGTPYVALHSNRDLVVIQQPLYRWEPMANATDLDITNLIGLHDTMSRIDFTGSILTDARILSCNLRESVFNNVTFRCCQFVETNFRNCQFNNANFLDCVFTGGTSFRGESRLSGTVFNNCKMTRAGFIYPVIARDVTFERCEISDMYDDGTLGTKAKYIECERKNSDDQIPF